LVLLGCWCGYRFEIAIEHWFWREAFNGHVFNHRQHELVPGPGRLAAITAGFTVVVVAKPHACGELGYGTDEPKVAGTL
jgi:hypothetical protein